MKIISEGFGPGGAIPSEYTCDGEGRMLNIKITEIPEGTECLAIIIDDPDAPKGRFTHFLAWNVPVADKVVSCEDIPASSVFGINSSGSFSYQPPCPPEGTHRYFTKIYALDEMLDLPKDSKQTELEEAMKGHIIKQAEIFGTYSR